jgi:glucan phosphoethanolaminetransferase (alkaline phosphatase superfamily)
MNDQLPENIIKTIEERDLTPTPRWHFLLTRSVFWILAVLSVVVGGVAFGVADYVFFDNDGMSLASLQQSSIQDIAQSIPYVWLAILAIFTLTAYYGFRKTRKGYRYATMWVVCGSIVASILLGITLNAFDFGQAVHKYLLSHTDFYDLLIHSSEDTKD